MKHKKISLILFTLTISIIYIGPIIFLLNPSKASAAGATMSWTKFPTTVHMGDVITLAAKITNNTGASITGNLCTLSSKYDKDTDAKLGAVLTYDTTPPTANSGILTYGSSILKNDPEFAGGTSYNIGFTFTSTYSIPNGQSANLTVKAKVRSNHNGSPGDNFTASFYCLNTASNKASDTPMTSELKISLAKDSNSSSDSTKTSSASKTSTTPDVPSLNSAKVNGQSMNIGTNFSINKGHSLELSGQTIAGGLITIYLHSDLQTFTTVADSTGAWSYTISDIESGSHYIEAEVKDPTSSKTSERKQILEFTVLDAAIDNSVTKAKSNTPVWLVILVTVILFGLGGYVGLKHWKNRKKPVFVPQLEQNPNQVPVPNQSINTADPNDPNTNLPQS